MSIDEALLGVEVDNKGRYLGHTKLHGYQERLDTLKYLMFFEVLPAMIAKELQEKLNQYGLTKEMLNGSISYLEYCLAFGKGVKQDDTRADINVPKAKKGK